MDRGAVRRADARSHCHARSRRRTDELLRLRLGGIRCQHNTGSDGDARPVCLLDVPTNKTGTAFTKPVDRTVGEAIEALLACRGAQLGGKHLNRVLIPLLCSKAGVPREDLLGQITGPPRASDDRQPALQHQGPDVAGRAASIARALIAALTQHSAPITPVTLTSRRH
jgi:hypothetical protein